MTYASKAAAGKGRGWGRKQKNRGVAGWRHHGFRKIPPVDLRRVESLRDWRGSGVLCTSH
ncbi:MAG: hypothetical protein ABGX05_06145, partial [Pirellulaceae bacterium]